MFEQNGTALLEQEPRCDVVAAEDCEILFLDMNKPMTTCPKGSAYHRSFVQNLLRSVQPGIVRPRDAHRAQGDSGAAPARLSGRPMNPCGTNSSKKLPTEQQPEVFHDRNLKIGTPAYRCTAKPAALRLPLYRAKLAYRFRFPAMALTTSSSTMGLAMWPFMPASSEAWTSSANALAVMAMMGMPRASGRSGMERMAAVAS